MTRNKTSLRGPQAYGRGFKSTEWRESEFFPGLADQSNESKSITNMPRTNFTDLQKAQIYARDKATCTFGGNNLWLLDHGLAGFYIVDWADHIAPASHGGKSSPENGLCVSSFLNYARSNMEIAYSGLFLDGWPSEMYFYIHETISVETAARLRRFENIHFSDWYYNRAVWHFCLGIQWLHDSEIEKSKLKRDHIYRAKTAFKMIRQWQKITTKEQVLSLEERGMVPETPSADQRLMLTIRQASSYESILSVMEQGLPYHKANLSAFDSFLKIVNEMPAREKIDKKGIATLLKTLNRDPFVSEVVRTRIETNIQRIFGQDMATVKQQKTRSQTADRVSRVTVDDDDGWGSEVLSDNPKDWKGVVHSQADFEKERRAMQDWVSKEKPSR